MIEKVYLTIKTFIKRVCPNLIDWIKIDLKNIWKGAK